MASNFEIPPFRVLMLREYVNMQFKSFGIQRRVSRKIGRESMSAKAESCELRTLLCASVISGGAVDSLELPADGDVDSPIKVAETDLNHVAPIDGEIFEAVPVEPGIDESVSHFGISDEIWMPRPDEAVQFVGYDSIPPGDDQGPVDGPFEGPFEGPFDSEDIGLQPVGWDPSWIYQTLNIENESVNDAASDDAAAVGEGHPDGCIGPRFWDGYAPDGLVDGPNGEKLTVDESVIFEDTPPVEGWDPAWVYRTLVPSPGDAAGDPENHDVVIDHPEPEFVMYASGVIESDDEGVDPRIDEADFEAKNEVFYRGASAPLALEEVSVELQQSHDSSNFPVAAVAPSALAIPVRQSSSIPLFSSSRDRSSVGIPADVQSNSALADNAIPAKRNSTQRRSTAQVTATRQSAASEGLINLTPLLGGDAAPSENDSHENTVDPQAVESGSVEEEVSDNGNSSTSATGFAANSVPTRSGRAALIDRVMAQYAENSFNS